MNRRLGAIHRPAPETIRPLAALVPLPPAKPETDWLDGVDMTDFGGADDPNLACGCCVERSAYQIARVRAHHAWGPGSLVPTAAAIVGLYTARTGYDPANPATDLGTDTVAFMSWWASAGLPLGNPAGDVDVIGWTRASLAQTPQAIDLSGPVRMTLALPLALQQAPVSAWGDAPGQGDDWAPGSWGAHSIAVGGQRGGFLRGESWGEQVWAHPLFLARYWLATDVAVSRFWLRTTGLAPSDLDWQQLAADVAALAPPAASV